MILLLDNYDSFTYNVFQLLSELGAEVEVIRNDKITIDEIKKRFEINFVKLQYYIKYFLMLQFSCL